MVRPTRRLIKNFPILELMHNTSNDHLTVTYNTSYSKQIFRTSSCKSVPEDRFNRTDLYRNRDSGTSSPQELKNIVAKVSQMEKKTKISLNVEYFASEQEAEESDSNDSVFSSGSSIDSNHIEHSNMIEIRDLYLGGSCMLRTTWRKDFVIPTLNQMGISYHLPMLHESIFNGASTTHHRPEPPTKVNGETESTHCDELRSSTDFALPSMFNAAILDASRVLLFVITNETRSLAPMTLAAHYIGLGYNVVLCVQMLPEFCVLGNDRVSARRHTNTYTL